MKQNDEAIFLLNLKKVIKMISELNINEFHRVLDEMTVEGTPSYKGNLLIFFTINFSDKPFYGFVSKNEFAISKNSNIKSMPYLIRGNFKKFEDKTEVDYEIKPIKFGYYWIKIMSIIFLIVALVALFVFISTFYHYGEINPIILVFFFMLFLSIFANVDLYLKKKNFEKLFLKKLKIKNF